MPVIDYYMSTISPFSHLGHGRLGEIADLHGAEVRTRPVDLLKVLAATGGVPVARRAPQRLAYRLVELRRWSAVLDMPLVLEPRHFPADGVLGAKVLLAAEQAGADTFLLAGALLAALWRDDRDPSDPETLASVLTQQDLDGPALVARAEQPETATALDAATDRAIAAGVFGVPTYLLDGEPFWGQDRLDLLDRALSRH